MADIAQLNVKLTASTGSFWKSIQQATKPVSDLGSSVLSAGSKLTAFAAPLAALAAGGGMAALVSQSFEAIDANGKLSDRLGLTTEKLVGLQHAAQLAGVNNELLTGSMEKMLKATAEAASGGSQGATFAALGLDPKALASMSSDQSFSQIAEKISKVENASQRAAYAQDIFGKSGQQLLPLLLSGAAGLAEMQKDAEKLGKTYTRIDAAKVELANDAMERSRGVITGLAQTAAISLAPYIQAAADAFTDWATAGGGFGTKVSAGVEMVAKAVAFCSDLVNVFTGIWYAAKAGISMILFGLVKTIQAVGDSILALIHLIPGMADVGTEYSAFMGGLADGLKDQLITAANDSSNAFSDAFHGKNQQAVSKFFDEVKAKSDAAAKAAAAAAGKLKGGFDDAASGALKAAEAIAKIQQEVDQFGLTDSEKKMVDLKALGATPEQLKQADALLAKLDELHAAKTLHDKANSIFDETRTPLEKYDTKIGELSNMLNAGCLDWDTYGRAVRQAREELEKASGAAAPQAPDAIFQGSAAAIRMAYDMTTGNRAVKDDLPRQQLLVAKDSRDYMELIERNTRNLNSTGGNDLPVVNI